MTEENGYLSDCVYQASRMVARQLGCSPTAALGQLTARAVATGGTLEEFATAVIDHAVRFDDTSDTQSHIG